MREPAPPATVSTGEGGNPLPRAAPNGTSSRDTARAMSQENMESVRRAFELVQEGLRRGDLGAAFDQSVLEGIVASNFEWRAGMRGGASESQVWVMLRGARGTWSS
jgi:hypothetical protein